MGDKLRIMIYLFFLDVGVGNLVQMGQVRRVVFVR